MEWQLVYGDRGQNPVSLQLQPSLLYTPMDSRRSRNLHTPQKMNWHKSSHTLKKWRMFPSRGIQRLLRPMNSKTLKIASLMKMIAAVMRNSASPWT